MQILTLPPKILRERYFSSLSILPQGLTKQSWNEAVSTPLFPNHTGILKTSIEIEPSNSLVVLMDSQEQSWGMVRRRVLNIVYSEALSPHSWISKHTGEWSKVFLLWITTHKFWVYVSTKTVGKQWPFQVPKLFSINMKMLSAKWLCSCVDKQVSINLTSLSLCWTCQFRGLFWTWVNTAHASIY